MSSSSSFDKKSQKLRLDVVLNPTKWQFQYQTPKKTKSKNDVNSIYCIKQLSSKDLIRIGRDVSKEDYPILPGRVHRCFVSYCRHWLNGICVKHPLIFVKENRPSNVVYNALDTVPAFLYVTQSSIPDAGLGVFTRIPLPAGACFGPYSGFLTGSKRAERGGYAWQKIRLDWTLNWVDAKSFLFSNWMRYVNCPRWEEEQNMVACYYYGQTYYYTYKPVPVDTELLIWYGESYARCLNISVEYSEEYEDKKTAPKKKIDTMIFDSQT